MNEPIKKGAPSTKCAKNELTGEKNTTPTKPEQLIANEITRRLNEAGSSKLCRYMRHVEITRKRDYCTTDRAITELEARARRQP